MTTAVATLGTHPTIDQRRAFLLEFAEQVVIERDHKIQPYTDVIALVVPTLVAAVCRYPLPLFTDLCDAVAERRRFDADPDAWLAAHDLPADDLTFDVWDESTQDDIEFSLDRLMGQRS